MEFCKHQNTSQYCSLCETELAMPRAVWVTSDDLGGLTSSQVEQESKVSSAFAKALKAGAEISIEDQRLKASKFTGSVSFRGLTSSQIEPAPTAILSEVITMLEPLSSEQRAKVIAATSAWFEGDA